jgi:hypothetical protein
VKKNQIHVLLPEAMSSFERIGRRINQTEIHHLDPGAFEPVADDANITFEPLFQSFELRPIGVQANAKKPDTERSVIFHLVLPADVLTWAHY